jgi:hypothetical protein
VTALISAFLTVEGNMPGELAAILGVDAFGALAFSLELQLDAPTSIPTDRTKAVRARRAGVKKFFPVRDSNLVLDDINFLPN